MISKLTFFISASLIFLSCVGQDTTRIQVFSFDDNSPEGWSAPYKKEINLPEKGEWSKIIMIRSLKCNERTALDKFPCGEWDYFTHTVIYSGENKEAFEIGSFITPYGKRLDLNGDRGWTWYYEITDYAPILSGKIEIESGNNAELLNLDILFISGKPTRQCIHVENIYPWGLYKYEHIAKDSLLRPLRLSLDSNASSYMIKARISGHGHNGPRNCCEWDSKTHTYIVNEWDHFRWTIWKDCSMNPIFPQGGTWPFDRAGWCPGTKVDEYNFELTPYIQPGDTIDFDYSIEAYRENGEKGGEFRMSHQLFSFGPTNFTQDVAIIDILAPNAYEGFSRENPICDSPVLQIQNQGKIPIRSLKIQYGQKGTDTSTYIWYGNLNFLEKQQFSIPSPRWIETSKKSSFFAKIISINDGKDENPVNDFMQSDFFFPNISPSDFSLQITTNTNGRAADINWNIFSASGESLYSGQEMADDSTYSYSLSF